MATSLPPPPRPSGKHATHERRRPALTREAIVEAALRVVDSEGFDALTMRRVGQELGTGGASLYAHVDNKEALIELVMDRVMSEVDVPWPPEPERWREQVKEAMRRIRATYRAHRDLARGGLARIPTGPNAVVSMERFLALLRASGLPDQVVAYAADLLPLYATAVAYEESLYEGRGFTEADMRRFVVELRAYFESLPSDRFPTVTALAAALTAGGEGDERFEFGLEVLVRGLEAMRG
jgi:AcrR family transcriptional regulator